MMGVVERRAGGQDSGLGLSLWCCSRRRVTAEPTLAKKSAAVVRAILFPPVKSPVSGFAPLYSARRACELSAARTRQEEHDEPGGGVRHATSGE